MKTSIIALIILALFACSPTPVKQKFWFRSSLVGGEWALADIECEFLDNNDEAYVLIEDPVDIVLYNYVFYATDATPDAWMLIPLKIPSIIIPVDSRGRWHLKGTWDLSGMMETYRGRG